MSRRLKKKDSPTSLAFTQKSIENLVASLLLDDSVLHEDFENVITCVTNGKDQLDCLKQLSNKVKIEEKLQSKHNIRLLCCMFMQCVSRHPMRRTLASTLQSTCENETAKNLIKTVISEMLSLVLIFNKEADDVIRKNTDMISALMENFKTGDEVVQDNHELVLMYLTHCLQQSCMLTKEQSNTIHQSKWMLNTLAILKTIIAVLQKCEQCMVWSLDDGMQQQEKLLNSCSDLLTMAIHIVNDNFFILDCQSTAAMLFPAIALLLPRDSFNKMITFISNLMTRESDIERISDCYPLTDILSRAIVHYFHKEPTPIAMLVFLHSLLVKIPAQVLHAKRTGDCSMFEILFVEKIIEITKFSCEKAVLILAFKTITIWVNMAVKKVEQQSPEIIKITTLNVLPHLVTFIDHQIDTIRHVVNTATKECFSMLSKADRKEIIDDTARKCFKTDMKSRGKIAIMINLSEYILADDMLKVRPTLPKDIIHLLSDIDLASHACDLYEVLSSKHLIELQEKCLDISLWMITWVEPIHVALSYGCRESKSYLVDYVIPSLLKIYPEILFKLVSNLKETKELVKSRAVIVFLKSLRSMKNMKKGSSVAFEALCANENENTWKNVIDMEQMKMCLTHIDDQVRLDTFSLICNSSKTTDPVSLHDMTLIKYFLKYNMASESPSFRQQTVTNVKKLLLRLITHASQIEKTNHHENVMKKYGTFLLWFIKFCFRQLYSCAPYCQLSLSLELLLLTSTIFQQSRGSLLFEFVALTEEEKLMHTERLIECFDDSYDPNRIIVYNVFATCPIFCTSLSSNQVNDIFQNALQRILSPQPDVSSIAAYYINFLALTVEKSRLMNLHDIEDSNSFFMMNAKNMNDENSAFYLLDVLFSTLKNQLSIMKKSLVSASQTAPLYGVLYCIRMMFQLQKFEIQQDCYLAFSLFLKELVEVGIEIIEHVSPYVSSDAPEGHLCDASLAEVFQHLNLDDLTTSNIEFQAQVARMLLVCCWRSMKEVSLLLGAIVAKFSSNTNNGLLPNSLLLEMWDMFGNILLRSKHAGAYELATLGFIRLCSVFWTSDDVELQKKPSDAVKTLIEDLLSTDQFDNAQVTRRSAGLPFFLQALCTTEPAIKAKQSFHHLMKSLTELCKNKMSHHDVNKLVIALNVLRAFFKDAKLCEDVFSYVSDGIMIAVKGFSSSVWAIRNSCTILFSALMQRVFGVKKFKMTGREFFSRFPALFSFLMEQAQIMVDREHRDKSINTYLHPSIFPVLLLLSHLYPATMEGSDSLMRLNKFVPYVKSCATSSVYKTRTMAAKALTPLISTEQTSSHLFQLLSELEEFKRGDGSTIDQNSLHGTLLQFKCLLDRYLTFSANTQVGSVCEAFHCLSWLCVDTDVSYVTKAVYVDVLTRFHETDESREFDDMVSILLRCLLQTTTCYETIGYSLFLRSAISFVSIALKRKNLNYKSSMNCEKIGDKETTSNFLQTCTALLKCPYFEVRITVFQMISDHVILFQNVSVDFVETFIQFVYEHDVGDRSYPKMIEAVANLVSVQEYADVAFLVKFWSKWHSEMHIYLSDAVRVAILKFVSVFLKVTHHLPPQIDNLSTIWNQMWTFIESSSQPKQCDASRYEVANMLCLQLTNVPANNDSMDTYRYFSCCFNLLKDADPDIRDTAACNVFCAVTARSSGDDFYRPQASVVMETLFNTKISQQMNEDRTRCSAFLICTMLSVDMTSFQHDVISSNDVTFAVDSNQQELLRRFVVFEEGKDNPYFDEKEICELAYNLLKSNKDLINKDTTLTRLLAYCCTYVAENQETLRSFYIKKVLTDLK